MDGGPLLGQRNFLVESQGVGHFRLVGELDMATAAELTKHVKPAMNGGGDVTLDLAELRFMDSSGIHALIKLFRGLDGRRLVLTSPRGAVADVLELIGIDRLPNVEIRAKERLGKGKRNGSAPLAPPEPG